MQFSIGEVSKLTRCKIPTIRWYEEKGLLPPAARSSGNQRRYDERHITLLRFIRHARTLGFDLNAVGQLLHLSQCSQHDPHEADDIAHTHLKQIRRRIHQLQALETELEGIISACCNGTSRECRILEILGKESFIDSDLSRPD